MEIDDEDNNPFRISFSDCKICKRKPRVGCTTDGYRAIAMCTCDIENRYVTIQSNTIINDMEYLERVVILNDLMKEWENVNN